MNTKVPLLRMCNITKKFPGVIALSNVNLAVFPGEVHILMGENGAGKSTLMKILSGAYDFSEGEIYIGEKKHTKWTPAVSKRNGIAMVYQEFNLVPYRTVTENMFLGRELAGGGFFLKKKEMTEKVNELFLSLGIGINTESLVVDLGIAQQQMVEIAKALLFDAKILVLDEPTAALTINETNQLFSAIDRLRKRSVGIIYISHRLDEVKKIGDRVSVLRDGKYIGTKPVAETDINEIVKMMVGREISMMYPRNYRSPGKVALRVRNLNNEKLKNVNFELRFGEILGFSGLVGAGRTEAVRAIFGLDHVNSGTITICDKEFRNWDVPTSIENGIGYVSEDRKGDGLFLNLSVQKNITITALRKALSRGIISDSKERKCANGFVEKLKIKTPKLSQKVGKLSGGNQQKVVIGKWLNTDPKILIFDEPTRGIDVGAKVEIHTLMDKLVNEGHAVIMISSDLPEVMGMSDRILVMSGGEIKKEFSCKSNPEDLISCAMGD